jgi:hypothetical protein
LESTTTEAEKEEIARKFFAAIDACDIDLLKPIVLDEHPANVCALRGNKICRT